MDPVEGVRIGPSDRSGKESVANETNRLRLGIDSITDAARRMAWCGETMDAETPDRDGASVVRGSKTILRGLPVQEADIVGPQIDRNLPSCQELLNPFGVVRMPMRQTDAGQPDSMGFEPGDHGRSVVGRVDEEGLTGIVHDIAVDPVAVDVALYSFDPRDRENRLRNPLL